MKHKADFDEPKGSPEDIRVTPLQEEREVKEADGANKRGRSAGPQASLPPVGNEDGEDVTDLILIIHGIGQGVSCWQSSE